MSLDAIIKIYIDMFSLYPFPAFFSNTHTQTHTQTLMLPHAQKCTHEHTHTHTNTSPFVPGRMTIKRPAALLDPWPLIPGGLPLPVLEVEEGWGSDKRRGCGGALRTAPSVRPAQASWVSSPSSVHWPLSCVFLLPQISFLSLSECVVNLNTGTHRKF